MLATPLLMFRIFERCLDSHPGGKVGYHYQYQVDVFILFFQFLSYWIRLLESQINADPCGSGSETLNNKWLNVATQLFTVATQLITSVADP